MSVDLNLDGRIIKGSGICGVVAQWDVGGGVPVRPCHGDRFIVLDDHRFIENNGARRTAAEGSATPSGLTYQTPIDGRDLHFDNDRGTRRTYGMDGACADLRLSLNANQRLVFSWKFICDDGNGVANNNFAMVLVYDGAVPSPQAAPTIQQILATNPPEAPLLVGSRRLPFNAKTERLTEGRSTITPGNPRFRPDEWSTMRWAPGAGGFDGTIRWLVVSGWDVSQIRNSSEAEKKKPSRDEEQLMKQRAFPATLLLDCIEIINDDGH